jgi:hypothetical protein
MTKPSGEHPYLADLEAERAGWYALADLALRVGRADPT